MIKFNIKFKYIYNYITILSSIAQFQDELEPESYLIVGTENSSNRTVYDMLNMMFGQNKNSMNNLNPQLIQSLLTTQMTTGWHSTPSAGPQTMSSARYRHKYGMFLRQ